jgi:S-adenosylmethionine decarboxylase
LWVPAQLPEDFNVISTATVRDNVSSLSVRRDFRDLAPSITRQRLVIEGYPTFVITDEHIRDYLQKLSAVTDMITLIEPVTHVSDLYGWAGWVHWETSGAHFYSWERPVEFFSVDIYTCKAFDPAAVVAFTEGYFRTTEIAAKEF